jgi:iron complex transport system substrate-binding protein
MIPKRISNITLSLLLLTIISVSIACVNSSEEETIISQEALVAETTVEIKEEMIAFKETINQTIDVISEAGNPVEIIDSLGRSVSFNTPPTAIASISPSATEMLYAAGGEAILRDRASLYPEEVLRLPNIGSSYDPSIEGILELNPDLVIIEALTQARFVEILSAANLNVMAVKAENIEDIKMNIRNIGTILGTNEVAEKNISYMETRLNDAMTENPGSVLFLISDREQNLYAATSKSYTGLIADLTGLTNAANELVESGPYPGFALMSVESILIANPDFIVTITPAPEPAPRLSQSLTMIPPFAGLKAIKNNAILEGNKDIFLQSPGPRIVEAVESLVNHIAGSK